MLRHAPLTGRERVRLGQGLVLAGVIGFWLLAGAAAARAPWYSPGADYLSALAAIGAREPWWGLAMFACGAVALAGGAVVLRGSVPVAAALMVASAISVAVAGIARVECPLGAAGCNAGPSVLEPTFSGQVHALAVVAYQVFFSAALLAAAWAGWREGRLLPVAVGVSGAVLTAVLALDPLPADPGWSQRLWVAAGHVVLVAVALCRSCLPTSTTGAAR
jgi:hypothetical protein